MQISIKQLLAQKLRMVDRRNLQSQVHLAGCCSKLMRTGCSGKLAASYFQ